MSTRTLPSPVVLRARLGRLPLPEIALALLMVVAAAILLRAGRDTTFFSDEWSFILDRRTGTLGGNYLVPHNEHFSAVPAAIYKLLFATVGIDDYRPYRVVVLAFHLLCVGLLYAYARRRLGPWLAVLAAAALLFYGQGGEDTIWPFQIGFLGSLACGLGALLALDRRDRRGDAVAAILLGVALASSGIGAPFIAAALVEVMWRSDRWRRVWLVALPVALYALWYMRYGVSAIKLRNAPDVPEFGASTLSSTLGALAGLGEPFGPVLALALAALVGWRLAEAERIPPRVAALVAALLAFLGTLGLSRVGIGPPNAGRYLYPCALLVLLLLVEIARGVRVRPRTGAILAGVLVVSAVSNLSTLRDYGTERRGGGDLLRARLAVFEVARDRVPPDLPAEVEPPHKMITASKYFDATDDIGSTPAYSASDLPRRSEPARAAADALLLGALGIEPKPGAAAPAGAPPALDARPAGRASVRGACIAFEPARPGANVDLTLPAGGASIRLRGARSADLRLRRFAQVHPNAPMFTVRPQAVRLAIPRDRSELPWHLRVTANDAVEVCGLGAA